MARFWALASRPRCSKGSSAYDPSAVRVFRGSIHAPNTNARMCARTRGSSTLGCDLVHRASLRPGGAATADTLVVRPATSGRKRTSMSGSCVVNSPVMGSRAGAFVVFARRASAAMLALRRAFERSGRNRERERDMLEAALAGPKDKEIVRQGVTRLPMYSTSC
jgi:hypothetical protein